MGSFSNHFYEKYTPNLEKVKYIFIFSAKKPKNVEKHKENGVFALKKMVKKVRKITTISLEISVYILLYFTIFNTNDKILSNMLDRG